MINSTEFAEQQRHLGFRIHEHDGEFWQSVRPFYCKPAFVYKVIERGSVRPSPFRSFLGYSHLVPDVSQGNRILQMMVITRETLDNFSLSSLPVKKRNQVRRSLERSQIQLIQDLDTHIERIREISIAQSFRQEQGAGAETPITRYTDDAESWRRQMQLSFSLNGRECWGAFVDDTLAAFIRTYQVDGTRVIQQAKVDTEYFKAYPMDGLYFTLLNHAAEDNSCNLIINGSPLHDSVNHYKEQFLFRSFDHPCYSSNACLVKVGKRILLSRRQKHN
ncbi:hypothetical protein JW823_06425 [bacterium]|nr:hypothetical protein [candidate division CSSED10-310 bacterium]